MVVTADRQPNHLCGFNPGRHQSLQRTQGSPVCCQATISVRSEPEPMARRLSSAIMSRQRWFASRRLRQRMASFRVLPSAIFVSKYRRPRLLGIRTWVTAMSGSLS